MTRKRVLILCTGNSCRSQMAEALWRDLAGETWEAVSAGSRPAGFVHPLAVRVMEEIGIDIAAGRSKSVNEFAEQPFDLVVTVCDGAREACPAFPNAKQTVHWPFEDPAHATGTDDERLVLFRTVRDRIRKRIERFLNDLP